jgi:hypothetical protein
MEDAQNRMKSGLSTIIIEPEIFVGQDISKSLITDKDFRLLLKHYQSLMFATYFEEGKNNLGFGMIHSPFLLEDII